MSNDVSCSNTHESQVETTRNWGAQVEPPMPSPHLGASKNYEKTPKPAGESSQSFSSRLPGFYELPITERLDLCCRMTGLSPAEAAHLHSFGSLSGSLVDVFIENAIGTFPLPLGVATNFHINGQDILVPMAVEETSVVAAASHGAKLARAGGGFKATSTRPVMTGQIQAVLELDQAPFKGLTDFAAQMAQVDELLRRHKEEMIQYANLGQERLLERGGGAIDLDWHGTQELSSVIIHIHVDTQDAMGANIVNTMCERLGVILPEIIPCRVGLRILTNLTDRRMARTECLVPWTALGGPDSQAGTKQDAYSGKEMVDRIVMAYQFAKYDHYRAATNNKGIMNGIDPVLIATGNDWRAIEAGAHAYAALHAPIGRYGPMAHWQKTPDGHLAGTLELPMAVGVVGGVTRLHSTAKAALKLMGSPSASELAQVAVSVGLAQNLSALRALASEGIQKGHMNLHQSNLELLRRGDSYKSSAEDPRKPQPFSHQKGDK